MVEGRRHVVTDRLRRERWPALLVAAAGTVPLAVLPLRAAADVWRAPALLPQQFGTRGLETVLAPGTRVGDAVVTSLVVGIVATAVALVIGWPAARSVARTTPARRTVLLVGLGLPLLVPPYATGTGLTRWLLELGLTDSVPGLVAAHLVYVVPYVVLTLTFAFTAELAGLEEAAEVAGADRLRAAWLVTLPTTAPAIGTAALLGFVVSWSQYGTSLAVGGGRLTLPVVLLPFVERDPQVAAALSLVFLAPPVVGLVALRRTMARR